MHPDYWSPLPEEEESAIKKYGKKTREKASELLDKTSSAAKEYLSPTHLQDSLESFMEDLRETFMEPLMNLKGYSNDQAYPVKFIDTSASLWPGYAFHTFNDSYVVLVDVPGIPKDEIKVQLIKDSISIAAAHEACLLEDKNEEESGVCLKRRIQKSFRIPGDVDVDDISVDFKDGVVVIKLPRSQSTARELKIKSEGVLKKRIKDASSKIKSVFGFQ